MPRVLQVIYYAFSQRGGRGKGSHQVVNGLLKVVNGLLKGEPQ